jgi:indolepyruvate ferredoxin oxidoreductase beta subunit
LPPRLAHPIRRFAERRGWRPHVGMQIQTTSVFGYLRFLLLAKLRPLRPRGIRFAEEQAQIEGWLKLIEQAAARSPDLAFEIAQCARLIKGYGDTYTRGLSNYRTIEARVIRRALAGDLPLERAVDAVASARVAALADPEGESLAKCLAEIDARAPMLQAAE